MKLTFKRREVADLQHLRTLVADNSDAMEPDLTILASNLNLGRTNVELAAIDARHRPVLFVLGLTADDAMLVRALEAYAWCLEYPESIQRLVPANVQSGWPPRMVFVAERLLEAFVRKMRLLSFSAVDCFEFRYVEANGTTGFYLDRVDWARGAAAAEAVAMRPGRIEVPVVEEPVEPSEEPKAAPREEPKLVLLREEARDDERDDPEEPSEEPREEPKVISLVPVEEPRIVMLHESKPTTRAVEPAPTNGAAKGDSTERSERERPERAPVLLKGLRPPTEVPPRRRSRDVPDLQRPSVDQSRTNPREISKSSVPVAPAATRASHVEPKATPAPGPRTPPQGVEPRTKSEPPRADVPKNGSKSDLTRNDVPKGELAPTWRKFLDRLTSTFDARTTPVSDAPRAAVQPSAPPPPPPPTLQPFAADIAVDANEIAPDEVVDEPRDATDPSEKQRRNLLGLTLPDNGELAPQWRKFFDHPTLDEAKIGVVRGYLQREFPLCTVYDFYDFQRNAQVFQLQDNHGKVTQLITMTAEFFDGHRDLEIRAWIEKHRLAQAMRQAGQAGVLVSQAGLQIEKR
jgi:hypothetical protein